MPERVDIVIELDAHGDYRAIVCAHDEYAELYESPPGTREEALEAAQNWCSAEGYIVEEVEG